MFKQPLAKLCPTCPGETCFKTDFFQGIQERTRQYFVLVTCNSCFNFWVLPRDVEADWNQLTKKPSEKYLVDWDWVRSRGFFSLTEMDYYAKIGG